MKTITGPRTSIEQDKGSINWFVMFFYSLSYLFFVTQFPFQVLFVKYIHVYIDLNY